MSKKITRKYVWIFTIICLTISNILWYIGYSIYAKDGEDSIATSIIILTSFMPAFITLAMTKITKEGWENLSIHPRLKTEWKAYLLSIVFTWFLIYLGDPLYLLIFKGNVTYAAEGCSPAGWLQVLLFSLLGLLCSIEVLGEELGWMGYLFPKLEQLHGTNLAILFTSLIRGLWHIGILLHMDHPLIGFIDLSISNFLTQSFLVYLTKKSKSIFPAAVSHAVTMLVPIFLQYSNEFYEQNIISMNIVGQFSALVVGGISYYLMYREKLILKKES